jgi:PAS domain S-box-containing protein
VSLLSAQPERPVGPLVRWCRLYTGELLIAALVLCVAAILATHVFTGGPELLELAVEAAVLTVGASAVWVLAGRRARVHDRTARSLEGSLDCVITITGEGRVVEFNRAAMNVFGYQREEAVGRRLSELIVPPAFREAHQRALERLSAGGPERLLGRRMEMPAMRADGSELPVELTIVRSGDDPPYFTGFLRDLSEHQETAQAQERLTALVASSNDAIIGTTVEGTVTAWNPAAERLFGYAAQEAMGRHFSFLVPPELREASTPLLEAVTAGDSIEVESQVLTRHGRRVDVMVAVSPIRDAEGVFIGFSGILRDITERKRAEEALRASEDRYRRIVETAQEGIWMADASDAIAFVNSRGAQMMGYEPEELIGRPVLSLFPPENRPDEEKRRARRREGHSEQYETRTLRKDGSDMWALVHANALHDDDGRYVGALAMVSDISARREWEEETRRLADIVESSDDAILSSSPDGSITSWNRGAERLYGYSPEESVGRSISLIVPDDRLGEEERILGEVREGHLIHNYETERQRADGSLVHVSLAVSPIFDREGRVVGASTIARDMTERRRAEEALQESEERYRRIVETANEGVLTMDVRDRITFANRKMLELFAYEADELLGRSPRELLAHADDYLALAAPQQEAADPKEVELVRRDGSRLWAFVTTSRLTDGEGNAVGALAMISDVTERVRAEQEAERLEAQLHQAQRLESVGQLAGGIAHDFNNLLAVIINYAEFALSEVADSPVREDVLEIRRAAEQAAALTQQLLVFSRREMVQPEVLSLNGVVNDMERMLRRTIGEHIELVVRREELLQTVRADRSQIEQVVMNLAFNARDAMPDGGRLTISTCNVTLDAETARLYGELDPADYVCLTVEDTGTGMTANVLRRAFDPFFTTKPPGSGTGLGLATTYGIVHGTGGSVYLDSEPGEGTSVRVYLPAVEEAVEPKVDGAPEVPRRGRGEAVLLVEDEEAVRQLAARILVENGYVVIPAAGPEEALELARDAARQIDLLLTDIVMPGMSGPQLAERVHEIRAGLPIMFMSGYTDRRDALPEDTVFVGKPFDAATLLREVRGALVKEAAR